MNIEHFPAFIRVNFPMTKDEDDTFLKVVGWGFKEYLKNKFSNNLQALQDIWDIDPVKAFMYKMEEHPFKVNGYHPVMLVHFNQFIEKYSQL